VQFQIQFATLEPIQLKYLILHSS